MSLDIWLTMSVDTGDTEPYTFELYSGNYTSNVTPMWAKAGVYDALYKSEGKSAKEILWELELGIVDMESKPEEYKLLNPENGWGDYDTALKFLKEFTNACKHNPKAIIGVWA